MAVPTPLDLLGPILGDVVRHLVAALAGLGLLLAAPRALGTMRQAAYERAVEAEMVRLEIRIPRGLEPDPEVAVKLARWLHPRQRRGPGPAQRGRHGQPQRSQQRWLFHRITHEKLGQLKYFTRVATDPDQKGIGACTA